MIQFYPIVGALLLAAVTWGLYRRHNERYLFVWSVSWTFYCLRFLLAFLGGGDPRLPLLNAAFEASVYLSGVLLAAGTVLLTGKTVSRTQWSAAAALGALIVLLALLRQPLATAINFATVGVLHIYVGVTLIRLRKTDRGAGHWLAGISFIIWGLHKLNYPLFHQNPELAQWGFMLGYALALGTGIGTLLIFLERAENDLAESGRSLEQYEEQLRRREKVHRLRIKIQQMVLDERPHDEVLRHLAEGIPEVFGFSLLSIRLLQPDGSVRVIHGNKASEEYSRDLPVRWDNSPDGQGITARCVRTGAPQTMHIDDDVFFPAWRERAVALGVRWATAIPMKARGVTIGVVVGHINAEEAPNPSALQDMETFAGQAALAIEASRNREELRLARVSLTEADAVRERYRLVSHQVRDYLWFVRPDGTFADVNDAAVEAYGYSREEFLAMKVMDIRAEGTLDDLHTQWDAAQNGTIFETLHRTKDGRVFPVEVSSVQVEVAGEHLRLSVVRDISERRAAEADRLELLHRSALLERMASLGTMVAGVCHEMRQPLQGIRVITDATLFWAERGRTPSPDQWSVNCGKISAMVMRLERVIQRLQAFVQRSQVHSVAAVRMETIIQSAFDVVEAQLKAHDIAVTFRSEAPAAEIRADFGRVEEAFVNVLVNAMQALDVSHIQNKAIDIALMADGGEVTVTIANNGPPIPVENLNRLFDPFFTTKFERGGMGLGLSIVHTSINEYGGRIEVVNQPPGVVFKFIFPQI